MGSKVSIICTLQNLSENKFFVYYFMSPVNSDIFFCHILSFAYYIAGKRAVSDAAKSPETLKHSGVITYT